MRSGNAVVCGVYRHGGGGDRISVKPVAPCLHGFRTNSYNSLAHLLFDSGSLSIRHRLSSRCHFTARGSLA